VLALYYPFGFESELLESNPYVDLVLSARTGHACFDVSLASEISKEFGGRLLILLPIQIAFVKTSDIPFYAILPDQDSTIVLSPR